MRKTLRTCAERSKFEYSGSVATGTDIWFGRKPYREGVDAEEYSALLSHFKHATVEIGTSFDKAPSGSVGEWLQANVTKRAIASYVGPILLDEGYAERVAGHASEICFR